MVAEDRENYAILQNMAYELGHFGLQFKVAGVTIGKEVAHAGNVAKEFQSVSDDFTMLSKKITDAIDIIRDKVEDMKKEKDAIHQILQEVAKLQSYSYGCKISLINLQIEADHVKEQDPITAAVFGAICEYIQLTLDELRDNLKEGEKRLTNDQAA